MDGKEIKRRREALGWSKAKLARRADVVTATLRSLEKGERATHPAVVRQIVDALLQAEKEAGKP